MFRTIQDIINANYKNGGHFFDPESMRFFRSKVYDDVIGGRCFITSEQDISYYPIYHKEPREYTLRSSDEEGNIDTIGEFGQYSSLRQVRAAAKEEPRCHGSEL